MAISSAGIGSNLDVNTIVSQLMAIEQKPLTTLNTKEAKFQAQLSTYGTIKGALSSLQSAVQGLTSSSTYTSMSASVSDATILSASATSSAAVGSYSIAVSQLAMNHAVRSNVNYATEDTFKGGTLAIQIGGGTAVNVAIADGSTLADISSAINSANVGVSASVINDGTTNRLVLTSNTTGSVGAITISVTQTGTGGTPVSPGVVQNLNDFNTVGGSLVDLQAATNAQFSVNGLAITRSSNTVTDVIGGVTLNLTKAGTIASPVTTNLTVSRNTGAVAGAIGAFVNAYNVAAKQLKSVSAYDATNKQASILTGDSTVRNIQSKLSSLLQTSLSGIAGGIRSLSDIGITLQKDGTLATDTTKLQAALNDPTQDVASLFASTTSNNKGIAVRFNEMLDGIVGSSGLINGRTDGISQSIKDIGNRRDVLSRRLVDIEARYRAQFTKLDTLISSMNQTSTFLTQQLASISNTNKGA
ncbi:MAG: flagellar hook protein [Hydrogenophilales bacterium CG_4_9_14_3_um_filter_59_35]|nr:MAG: flagellar hook protein [Hydrogenophilales bacterium CG18_big_fil_WC_8_21_14_2_50_58_12]PIY01983.1 MAG: flagellar hook protein [Hydrogenophilales bacterium CG_4_10_14_3_um_filter_58_23]PJB06595.1 MAG: flagellar hook protein [Hydrogenophilales bacterium CG_4_9_14_3_um_filter_59_35]